MEDIVDIVFDKQSRRFFKIYYEDGEKKKADFMFSYFFYTDFPHEGKGYGIKMENSTVCDMYGKQLTKVTLTNNNMDTLKKFKDSLHQKGYKTYLGDVSFENKALVESGVKLSKYRRVLYIDIETDLCNTPYNPIKPVTSVCLYFNGEYYMFLWREDLMPHVEVDTGRYTFYFKDEIKMLQSVFAKMAAIQPDIIAGWYSNDFDIPYLIKRSEILSMTENIDYKQMSIFGDVWLNITQTGEEHHYKIYAKGVYFVDLIPVLKKAIHKQPAAYNLDITAKYYLGPEYGKYTGGSTASWRTDLTEFIKYNMMDVELTVALDQKLGILDYLVRVQTEIVPTQFNQLMFNSIVLDNYLRYTNKNMAFADNDYVYTLNGKQFNSRDTKVEYEGARVIEPKSGKYKNVVSFDFASMYTTIFATYNISPETVDDNGDLDLGEEPISVKDVRSWKTIHEGKLRLKFNTKVEGCIPSVIENIINLRNSFKQERNKYPEGTVEWKRWNGLQDGIKEVGNSMYGVFGFTLFRLFDPKIAAGITKIGRMMSHCVEDYCNTHGANVIYGDTDSIFVYFGEKSGDEVKALAKKLETELNDELKQFTLRLTPNRINKHKIAIKMENFFPAFFLPAAKKKYAGLREDGTVYIKGLELIKRDTPEACKDILNAVFKKVLETDSLEEVKAFTQEQLLNFKTKYKHHQYGFIKQVSKFISDYDTNVQHIRAVEYSNKHLGTSFTKSDRPYILFVLVNDFWKYPDTDILALEYMQSLPQGVEIDFDVIVDKFVVKKMEMLNCISWYDNKTIFSEIKARTGKRKLLSPGQQSIRSFVKKEEVIK